MIEKVMFVLKSKTLIIFSGLPASGKTTLSSKLAAHLQATFIRMDAIALGLASETYDPELSEKCYRIARSLALVNLRLNSSVVSDSINPNNQVREDWNKVAYSAGAKIVHIEIICSNKEEHQNRLKSRTTTLVGLIDPTWQEIQQIDYHQWDQDRIIIDTSGKSEEVSFEEILFSLQNLDL